MPAIKLKKVTAEYLAEKEREAEKNKRSLEDVADEEDQKEKENVDEDEAKPFNFLDVEVLWDKRKRTIPLVEQILIDWLDTNLEKRTEVYLPLQTLYNYYSEVCQMRAASVVDIPLFNRYVREKYGKFFGFQENSPYRVLIKERKVKEKTKVQGETLQLKIRDIITEVIGDAGNPRKGLRFPVISKAIVSKYPAQRVDLYPKKLKGALERGVSYGYFELVRGVGMCGYYRLPGDPTKEEEEEEKKEASDEKDGEAKGTEENGTADTDEGKSEEEEGGEKPADKGTKRPAADVGESGDAKDGEPPQKKAKKKVVKKKKKKPVEVYRSDASRHSDPQRVEDAFAMAILYQSDPKEASGQKIAKYISKFYHKDVSGDRLKKALETGIEKGMWEQTKGNGLHGSYHLLVDTFNPGRSDTLSDQIAQALVACHEPKQASAGLIKKYINQYHSKLNIEAKPHLFRNALERACQKGTLRQLSGIGASGTFQLVDPFNPSPAILAGDSEDDDSEAEEEQSDEEVVEKYVPKPTKRGRVPSKSKPRPPPVKESPKKSPKKGKNTQEKKTAAKSKPKSKSPRAKPVESSDEEEKAEVVKDMSEYTPRPSSSRGGGGAGRQATPVKPAPKSKKSTTKSAKKATPKSEPEKEEKKTPVKKPAGSSSKKKPEKVKELEEEEKEEKSTPKSPPKSSKGASKSKSSAKRSLVDVDSDVEDIGLVDEYVPKPTKSRRGTGESAATSGKSEPSSAKKRRR